MLFKLKQNGISGNLLNLFSNYLSNRKQRVVVNGYESDYVNIESGVPQGSVLGPLLFLIYINDLEKNIKSNIKIFADDTMLYSIVKNPKITAEMLNKDLETIMKWAFQWKLEFNPDVNKQATEIIFSCKKTKITHPKLIFNGFELSQHNEVKHLGLILESDLSFKKHIYGKINKAKHCLSLIKHVSKFFPLKTLSHMYKALIRSHLDYCDIVYHTQAVYSQNGMIL